jgi:hypothetical protein
MSSVQIPTEAQLKEIKEEYDVRTLRSHTERELADTSRLEIPKVKEAVDHLASLKYLDTIPANMERIVRRDKITVDSTTMHYIGYARDEGEGLTIVACTSEEVADKLLEEFRVFGVITVPTPWKHPSAVDIIEPMAVMKLVSPEHIYKTPHWEVE